MHLPNYIEIETSKFCNRSCKWCPVGKYNLRKEQQLMEWELFLKILTDLSECNYTQTIALHNYNEPLLNPRLYREIAEINLKLPNVQVMIFSNGDFLNNEVINNLNMLNISLLRITLYPQNVSNNRKKNILNWLDNNNLRYKYTWSYDFMPDNKGIYAITSTSNMRIKIISPNLQSYNTRAGLIDYKEEKQRVISCNMTTTSAAIDYLGNFRMCCNILTEIPEHKDYVFGNMNNKSFKELWFSKTMKNLRTRHMNADWNDSPICKKCYKLGEK